MTSACRELEWAFKIISDAPDHKNVNTVFNELFLDMDSNNGNKKLRLFSLIDSAIEEISLVSKQDNTLQKRLEFLDNLRLRLINGLSAPTVNHFKSAVKHAITVARLGDLADTVEEHGITARVTFDTTEFVSQTGDLIESVKTSKLPEHAKQALYIKLNAARRLVQESSYISHDDIRRKVKSIFADMATEYEELRKHDQTVYDEIKKWAIHFTQGSVLALALTADVSQLGLLEQVDGPPQIEDHSGGLPDVRDA